MSKKNKVSFCKPPEPAFIVRMKERIGWKEGPNVDTKRVELPSSSDCPDYDRVDPTDEKPVVVTLEKGDLTAEEAAELQRDLEMDDKTPGRFRFKKPDASKSANKKHSLSSCSTSTKRPLDEPEDRGPKSCRFSSRVENRPTEEIATNEMTSSVNQRQLLSFGDEDEDS